MGAVIQFLYACEALRLMAIQPGKNSNPVLEQLGKVFTHIQKSPPTSMRPVEIQQIIPEAFRDLQQHDAADFLYAFFDRIDDVDAGDLFALTTVTTMKCDTCGQRSAPPNDLALVWDLTFDDTSATHGANLQGLLNRDFAPEIMSGENQFKCTSSECRETPSNAQREHAVVHAPEFLLLSLKRFRYDCFSRTPTSKIMAAVALPTSGDVYKLARYCGPRWRYCQQGSLCHPTESARGVRHLQRRHLRSKRRFGSSQVVYSIHIYVFPGRAGIGNPTGPRGRAEVQTLAHAPLWRRADIAGAACVAARKTNLTATRHQHGDTPGCPDCPLFSATLCTDGLRSKQFLCRSLSKGPDGN